MLSLLLLQDEHYKVVALVQKLLSLGFYVTLLHGEKKSRGLPSKRAYRQGIIRLWEE